MDWTVCSREMERDYTWDDAHASHLVSEYVQRLFAPAFEGSVTNSRFVTLLRCPNSLKGIILSVSASTDRQDLRHTFIRTLAVLRAETPEETDLLVRFFSECLRKEDKETLYNAKSGVAKAVESLYQTKKLDDFMQFCRSLPTVNCGGVKLVDRWEIPRDDTAARRALTESLPALIGDNKPFLLALTDRLPTDVLGSLGSMFDHAVVRIFSKAITTGKKLPEPASQKYRRAAAIGGGILLAILAAAIGSCSRGCGKAGDRGPSKAPIGTEGSETNVAPGQGIVEANDQTDWTGGGTNTATNRLGSGGFVTDTATQAPPQEAIVTNSLKDASTRTR